MNDYEISARDPYVRQRAAVLDSEMAYIDVGEGDPIVLLHGNPTSSYLWRNVIPHIQEYGRCLAPDLIGMGDSGKNPSGSYRFVDHKRYLDAWFEVLGLERNVTLVLHDWGSGLGFHWAHRHPERIKGLVYMEAGESRRPTLTWPRQIPIDGEPADVHAIVDDYARWLASSELPKLLINAEPGAILRGNQHNFCRTWLNQKEVTVPGIHFIQEDSPREIGQAIRRFLTGL